DNPAPDDVSSAPLWATIAGAIVASACGALAHLFRRNRHLAARLRRQEERIEELSDRNFELKEAEERTRSLLDAQGDVIVRRDPDGRIAYANDAYCALIGRPRAQILGTILAPTVAEQGTVTASPDGTRVHDQKIDASEGARWIAWRDVPVRGADGHTETQS